jgi:hypothetical protein
MMVERTDDHQGEVCAILGDELVPLIGQAMRECQRKGWDIGTSTLTLRFRFRFRPS